MLVIEHEKVEMSNNDSDETYRHDAMPVDLSLVVEHPWASMAS
jgi:hypothetical protein